MRKARGTSRFLDRASALGWITAVLVGVVASGCSATDDGDGSVSQASRSRWELPQDIRRVAVNVSISYEGAPAWSPRNCGGKLLAGTSSLGRHVMGKFSAVKSVGGYACRPNTANTSRMSVHGTGRALDIFIPTVQGRANSDAGDAVANWLVKNAADIGVQLVIWNRSVWQSNGRAEKAYTGPVPHTDHIHVEVTTKAAKKQTPFFNRMEVDGENLDGDAGITTTEPDEDAGDIPVVVADAGKKDATVASNDAGAPPKPAADAAAPPSQPPAEEDDADHPVETREYDPDLDDDGEHGEEDSLGTGIRDVNTWATPVSDEEPNAQGCSAAPMQRTNNALGISLAIGLAATLVRRRKHGK